jgi:NCS1 family nucleobase:cation symporter-1
VQGVNNASGWDHIYDLSYFFGFLVSMTIHVALHKIFPASNQIGSSPFHMELHRSRQVNREERHGYVGSITSHEDEAVVIEAKGSVA